MAKKPTTKCCPSTAKSACKTPKKPTTKKGFDALKKSSIPMNFVKECNGCWDHAGWLSFLELVKEKGYEICDVDQIGLLLEEKKEQYFAQKG
jgi:hypothetical protein